MKRILSILLSVTIVASILVSMSVTSFAATEYVDPIKFRTDVTPLSDEEKAEYQADYDFDLSEKFVCYITAVFYDFGDLSCTKYKTSGSTAQRGLDRPLGMSNYTVMYKTDAPILEFYNVSDAVNGYEDGEMVDSLDIASDFVEFNWIDDGEFGAYQSGGATIANVMPNKVVTLPNSTLELTFFVISDTDTFTLDVDQTMIVLSETSGTSTFVSSKLYRETDALAAGYGEVLLDEPTVYIKGGAKVSKEEYEGGSSEPTTYTVTFKNGDSVLSSADVEEGAAVTAPAEPSAPVDADEAYNYTFAGWSDGSNTYASNAIPVATDNVEYVATFNSVKKTYTITFSVDGATTTQTVEHGETPSYAGTPSKEGYTFTGWDKDFAPATENTTYTAQFAIKTYTITFIVDGVTSTKTVNHGETPDYGSTPAKDGYNFTGWSPAIVPATGAATYTAQFSLIPPTEYEITFVVEGVETKINVIEGQTPVYPNGTPAKDGYNFTGWTPAIVPATGAATYTAQFELIPVEPEGDAVTMDEPVYIDGSNGDILPGGVETVTVQPFGMEHTVKAAELLRVHTDFTYDSSKGTLKEMGMLFVPKAVAGSMGKDEIIAAEIAKDACCTNIPYLTGGGNVTFKAGLVDIPYKNIEIYAIPYYKLSGGERIYQAMQTILFE